jgi:plasmid stabilization system protein ParE
MKLVITDEATADLKEIADWIAAGNPRRAFSFVDELKNRCARLDGMGGVAGSHMAPAGQELRRGCPKSTFKRQIAQS